MLYVIVAERWISGVFAHERDAREYLLELPEEARSSHVLSQLVDLNYPLYIVEDAAGFRFLTAQQALDDIIWHSPSAKQDDCCLTLFRIDRDYRPRVAGEDEMGRLHHLHVDNELLARVQREGLSALPLLAADV